MMNTPLSNEARALAYQSGVKALGPLVDRIIKLEREVEELKHQRSESSTRTSEKDSVSEQKSVRLTRVS